MPSRYSSRVPFTRAPAPSERSLAQQDHEYGLDQDLEVEPQAVVTDVLHTQPYSLLVLDLTSSLDLPGPGNARLDSQQIEAPLAVQPSLVWGDHARTYQAHLAA